MVRHRFLVPACKGSNPFTPDYEHPIGSVKNELTTTGELGSLSPACGKPRRLTLTHFFAKRREREGSSFSEAFFLTSEPSN